MDSTLINLRAIVGKMLELYDDWILADRKMANLMEQLDGTIASMDDVNKGLESLYMAPPALDGYSIPQSGAEAESLMEELVALKSTYTELLSSSMRLQMQNMDLVLTPGNSLQSAACSAEDLSLAIDRISSMFLKEFAVKDRIMDEVTLTLAPETLSCYITIVKTRPFLDELYVDALKDKVKLLDQIGS